MTEDNRDRTPLDCLKELVADLESGTVQPKNLLIVFETDENAAGGWMIGTRLSNLSPKDIIFFAEIMKKDAVAQLTDG